MVNLVVGISVGYTRSLVAVKGELTGDLFVFTSSYQVRSNQIKVGRSAYSIIYRVFKGKK